MATDAEKKSTGFAGKVTAAAERRQKTRDALRHLRYHIGDQLLLENALVPDEPEGTVAVHLEISKTLAEQLVDHLERAESMI